LGRVLASRLQGPAIFVERRDVFSAHTFDNHLDESTGGGGGASKDLPANSRVCLDVSSLDLPALFAEVPAPSVLVCAKHLCGVGTDAAIDCVERAQGWPHLIGFVIAPCCHQTILWHALPESCRNWFLERGFQPSWWSVFKLLLHLSKSGKASATFGSFAALSDVPPMRLHAMGRLARRCIEEARCSRLNHLGFSTTVFRYSAAAVSPDNLVIVAQPSPKVAIPQRLRSAVCPRNVATAPGVILRLECMERAGSVVSRLYAFKHQLLARAGDAELFHVAWEQTLYTRQQTLVHNDDQQQLQNGGYEVVVVVTCASIPPLLAFLHSDRVIRCAIRQIFPFSHQSASTAVLQREARSVLSKFSSSNREHSRQDIGDDGDVAVRLLCWPPPLLNELMLAAHIATSPSSDAALSSASAATSAYSFKLHPTQYSAAVCAVEWHAIDAASDEVRCDEAFASYGGDLVDIEEAHRNATESGLLQYGDPRTGWKYVPPPHCASFTII
jgi:hypothetical protein